jgi:predicted nucleotidyltransferase
VRLSNYTVDQIKKSFDEIFHEGSLYLFGSRVDDSLRGGDIDLFIELKDKSDLFEKKIKFLACLKRAIGDQRIDVVFNEDDSRLVEQEVRKCAIML